MSANDIRLVCFDLNGTLINENSWMNLNFAMRVTPAEDEELLTLYRTGKLSYQQGLNKLLPLYKRGGKFQKDTVLHALFQYTYTDGAKEIVSYLQKKNYQIAILSGSFDILVEKVACELQIPLRAANNHFVFDEKGEGIAIECAGNDDVFKRDKLLEMCSALHINPTDCACVGDSENDREIFRLTGKGIAIRSSLIEKEAWKIIDKLNDIKSIF
jgi:phosphoserine phosphatase